MSKCVLEAKQLSFSYSEAGQELQIFQALDLQLETGTSIAIIGQSGSGKSSLLNLLAGLEQPHSGEVLIQGQNLALQTESQRTKMRNQALGFVYQFHHLLPEFSALENIALPLLLAKEPLAAVNEKTEAMLKQVGLADRATHKPAQLSGGERQRVAIGRALINNPAFVLMDEPTGNLDQNTAGAIQELISQLSRDLGIAFILVTHDLVLAQKCDYIYELKLGKLIPADR